MSGLALGIDLGTTAVKAAILDGEGRLIRSGSAPARVLAGPNGLAEQEAEGIWRDARDAVRSALSGTALGPAVRAVALSSQGGTLVLLDDAGAPIGNAISWMDTRPARLGPALLQGRDDAFFYEKTGWSLRLGALPLAQLLRLRAEAPETLRRARRVHFVDSYVVERLVGEGACDPSDAAITMLYNVRERRWDAELLALAGIVEGTLPRVVASGTPLGRIRGEAAAELGISPEATIVAGGHDQYCAAFGAGCTRAGETIVSCGTAWVVLAMTSDPRFDREARLAPAEAVAGGLWGLLGSCSGVGAAVGWFRHAASGAEIPFETLEAAAAAVEPAADGIVFVPPASDRGGRLLGLRLHHGFGHVARAVLEGPALGARALLARMRKAGCEPSALRAVGGATRSRPWMQILSDATGLPLEIAGVQDVASYGAARLAGQSTGLIPPDAPWPAARAPGAGDGSRIEPRPEFREAYDALFERFGG